MPNHLAQSPSLYLRKHAENPIDWWFWCDDALETARRENKPIFLSIGYSSCHWCTVMEGEAFSDAAIATYLNANFLPIKVDREERPDLDSIYMQALQMMTGQGGWPLNVFLSPEDLIPFYGGTYFPIEPRYGRPGFLKVLQALRHYYDTQPEDVQALKQKILGNLQSTTVLQPTDQFGTDLLPQGLVTSTSVLSSGGYGPSFPMMPYADLALRGTRFPLESDYDGPKLCLQRGMNLALGGIYDQVGGGFHRYTVDPTWTVPHFEKMLYDNGQIVEYLANLWSTGYQEPAFERSIAGTVQWLQREMTAPEGYFYAAQDADSFGQVSDREPEEGLFYVWNYAELGALLTPEELVELVEQFTISSQGNFEGKIVLQRRHLGALSASLEAALDKLFQVRYGTVDRITPFPPAFDNQTAKTHPWPGRIPPVTDPKMIVAWNSLMISGLARAGVVFGKPDYLALASRAATFILAQQRLDGRLHRLNYQGQAAVLAQSEDYALLIKALLDLHQADGDQTWLTAAVELQDEFDQFLWSLELGGYYNTASDASQDLLVRERSYTDNATPAANGVAIANLVRLSLVTENLEYLDRAGAALQTFGSVMQRVPQACPSLFTALDWYQNQTLIRTSGEWSDRLKSQYLPTAMITTTALPPDTVGLVCQGLSCKAPARSAEQLQQQVSQSQVRSWQ